MVDKIGFELIDEKFFSGCDPNIAYLVPSIINAAIIENKTIVCDISEIIGPLIYGVLFTHMDVNNVGNERKEGLNVRNNAENIA
jgi:hypothetical protein